MSKVPFCKFCGQLISVSAPADANEETLQEIGTEHCSCWSSEEYRKRKMQILKAKVEISALFETENKTRGIKKSIRRLLNS